MNGLWLDILVMDKLGTSKEEREEMVIVQAPDAMAAGRFQPVHELEFAHDLNVHSENAENDIVVSCRIKRTHVTAAQQECHEETFIARSVIDALSMAERG